MFFGCGTDEIFHAHFVYSGFTLGVAVSAVFEIVSALGFHELVEDAAAELP
jgi:hypothetical protein